MESKRNRKVLVMKTRAIGDTVLLTGVLRVLKEHRPSWSIHALVPTEAAPLLEGLPYIDRIIGVREPAGPLDRLAFWLKMVRKLRDIHYDQILNFHASMRTSFIAKCLRAELCVANHHKLKGRNYFSDLPVPGRGKVKAIIDRDLDLLRAIGVMASVDEALPELRPYPHEAQRARELLESKARSAAGYVFLGIGASRATKKWAPEHFIELIGNILLEKKDHFFVITSVPADRDWLEEFLSLLSKKTGLPGFLPGFKEKVLHFEGLSLRMVMAIASLCKLYIGNDSGLKHLAAAAGVPTFTFFGPEDPKEWHPYAKDKHRYAFIEGLACRTETGKHWCPVEYCTAHEHRCMVEITPRRVLREIMELLDNA